MLTGNNFSKLFLGLGIIFSIFYLDVYKVSAKSLFSLDNESSNSYLEGMITISENEVKVNGKKYSYEISVNYKKDRICYSIDINYDHVGFCDINDDNLLELMENFISNVDQMKEEKDSIKGRTFGTVLGAAALVVGTVASGGTILVVSSVGFLTLGSGSFYTYVDDILPLERLTHEAEMNFNLAQVSYQKIFLSKK